MAGIWQLATTSAWTTASESQSVSQLAKHFLPNSYKLNEASPFLPTLSAATCPVDFLWCPWASKPVAVQLWVPNLVDASASTLTQLNFGPVPSGGLGLLNVGVIVDGDDFVPKIERPRTLPPLPPPGPAPSSTSTAAQPVPWLVR